jgi:hypothetical protein
LRKFFIGILGQDRKTFIVFDKRTEFQIPLDQIIGIDFKKIALFGERSSLGVC